MKICDKFQCKNANKVCEINPFIVGFYCKHKEATCHNARCENCINQRNCKDKGELDG